MSEVFVPTPVGTARITWYPARDSMRAVALLGHGSATGIESPDLQAPGRRAAAAGHYGPGSPAELLATGRPVLVVQGGNDPFGRPGQFPPLPHEIDLVEIPSANHTFGTRTGVPYSAAMTLITTAATEWIDRRLIDLISGRQ